LVSQSSRWPLRRTDSGECAVRSWYWRALVVSRLAEIAPSILWFARLAVGFSSPSGPLPRGERDYPEKW